MKKIEIFTIIDAGYCLKLIINVVVAALQCTQMYCKSLFWDSLLYPGGLPEKNSAF